MIVALGANDYLRGIDPMSVRAILRVSWKPPKPMPMFMRHYVRMR